jgi:putative RecB family exonuclease
MQPSVPVYSHSRLSSYEKCPRQYQFRYLDKIKRDTQGIEAFVGNRVHEVLERLYRDLMSARRPSLEELVVLYHRNWDAEFSDKVKIVRTERTAESYQETGEDCIENYYRRHEPFDQATTLGLEERVTVSMDEANRYRLQGYVDRLARTGEGVYEIHDYKTSASLPSDAHLRSDRQLTIYQMAVQKRYPDAREVRLIWHYLALDRTLTSSRTDEEVAQHRRQTIRLIDAIEAAKSFPTKVSSLCRWCDYMDICPEFATAEADAAKRAGVTTEPPAPRPSPGPLQRLAALHDRRRAIDAEVAGLRGQQAGLDREIAGLEAEILAGLPQPSAATPPVARRESRGRRRASEGAAGSTAEPPRQRQLFSN